MGVGMKVERKLSDFSAEKWKCENGNGNLRNKNGNGIFLAKVETKMEQRFPAEQMRKRKFLFPANTEFPVYGCFA
jgi:hypothetical protein